MENVVTVPECKSDGLEGGDIARSSQLSSA